MLSLIVLFLYAFKYAIEFCKPINIFKFYLVKALAIETLLLRILSSYKEKLFYNALLKLTGTLNNITALLA